MRARQRDTQRTWTQRGSVWDAAALTALTLCQTRVTDASLHAIAAHLPNLVYLDLGGCRQFTAQGVGVLAGLTSLRHLNLHNTLTRGGAGGSTIALAGGCRELR